MKTFTAVPAIFLASAFLSRADFHSGQRADLAVGGMTMDRLLFTPTGVAVDPNTHKVFVADGQLNRILRFTDAEAMANGGRAEAVLAQPDFDSTGAATSATSLSAPRGLSLDDGGRLWVADTGNHRVVCFSDAVNAPSGAAAARVLGQPSFTSLATGSGWNLMKSPHSVSASRDGRLWVADTGNHRILRFDNAGAAVNGAAASASLGDGTPATGPGGLHSPRGVSAESALTAQGWTTRRLWVADSGNSRVLRFDDPAALPAFGPASGVLGQADFLTLSGTVSQNRMVDPEAVLISSGNLWVAEPGQHRVLVFERAITKANGANANLVLGQASYATNAAGSDAGGLTMPAAIATDGGRLWIADSSNRRVVRHEAAVTKAPGNDADGVIGEPAPGQPIFEFASDAAPICIDPVTGRLFVCEPSQNRVLRFANVRFLSQGAAPEAVLGQPNFSTVTPGLSPGKMNAPSGLAMDWSGHLWVSDTGNNRILRFDNASTAPNGAAAAHQIGQADFTSNIASLGFQRLNHPGALAIEVHVPLDGVTLPPARLWVADRGNRRVLAFNHPASMAALEAAAAVLGAPDYFTTGSRISATSVGLPGGLFAEESGRLWVADEENNRVLRFDAPMSHNVGGPANGVLLQPSFTTGSGFTLQTSGVRPMGLAMDWVGRLYVCDVDNWRLLWFDDAAHRSNGAPADGVLGQHDFVSTELSSGWNRLVRPHSCAFDAASGRLWVTNSPYGRLFRYTPTLDTFITGASIDAQGKFIVSLRFRGGEIVDLRSSPDLIDWSTNEEELRVPLPGWHDVIWSDFTIPPGSPRRFFRLQVP